MSEQGAVSGSRLTVHLGYMRHPTDAIGSPESRLGKSLENDRISKKIEIIKIRAGTFDMEDIAECVSVHGRRCGSASVLSYSLDLRRRSSIQRVMPRCLAARDLFPSACFKTSLMMRSSRSAKDSPR